MIMNKTEQKTVQEQGVVLRSSPAEFLIFQAEAQADGVEVFYKDKTIWATQKAMAALFGVQVPAVNKHLKNIYAEGELDKKTTFSKMEIVVNRGIRGEIQDQVDFYNLDAIISVGYRVNSLRATQFRRRATSVLQSAGTISSEQAKEFAETEFEKYRVVQDRLFVSDFDRMTELPFEER